MRLLLSDTRLMSRVGTPLSICPDDFPKVHLDTTTSSNDASCSADIHHFGRDRDKSASTVPDVKSILKFVHTDHHVSDTTPSRYPKLQRKSLNAAISGLPASWRNNSVRTDEEGTRKRTRTLCPISQSSLKTISACRRVPPVTLGGAGAGPDDLLRIDSRLLLFVSWRRRRLVANTTTVGRDDVGHADPTNETCKRGDAPQTIVPAVNQIEPVISIDAEPEEELEDGKAGAGGFGGGDEVDEDAEDAHGERAVAVRASMA
jgi:hypothetical protein